MTPPSGSAPTPPTPPSPGYGPAPYVPTLPGGAKSSNGLAIAALVLGIISVLCLGPIAGIVAIVLGVLGMKKSGQTGSGKGMSIAGLVLGVIGTLIGIVIIVAVIAAGDDISDSLDDIAGPADSSDYEIDVPADACSIDEFGSISFEGTIENTAGRDMSFIVNGEIRDSDTNVVIDTRTAYVEVAEDSTAQWEITAFVDDPVDIKCKVTGVDNFLN